MPVGKRIYLRRELPDPEIVEGFRGLPASNIADTMERSSAMNPRIKLLSAPKAPSFVGVALTVKNRAGDNLTIHKALDLAGAGDVVVVSNEEEETRSLVGAIMITYARVTRKVAGIVLDGPIRDLDEVAALDFPVYATGSTPGGPYKEGPGEINVPISCGGIAVFPGDIIVGDPDGVIVIPRNDAAGVLEAAQKFAQSDAASLEKARLSQDDRAWVDQLIKAKGYEIIDDVYR